MLAALVCHVTAALLTVPICFFFGLFFYQYQQLCLRLPCMHSLTIQLSTRFEKKEKTVERLDALLVTVSPTETNLKHWNAPFERQKKIRHIFNLTTQSMKTFQRAKQYRGCITTCHLFWNAKNSEACTEERSSHWIRRLSAEENLRSSLIQCTGFCSSQAKVRSTVPPHALWIF